MNKINVQILGAVDYDTALKQQLDERERVRDGGSSGTIFILEHNPPVITIGRNATKRNLLFAEDILVQRGFEVRKVSRGGDVTAHEPGQVVVYFVLPVRAKEVKAFIENIMNIILEYIKDKFSLNTEYFPDKPGIWYNNKKICSIGFDLTENVSMHGIALNVSNSLEAFRMIVPCGMSDVKMTTLSTITGYDINVEEVMDDLSILLKEI